VDAETLSSNSQIHALGMVAVIRTVFDHAYQWKVYYLLTHAQNTAPGPTAQVARG
jgi:hypothetical protein